MSWIRASLAFVFCVGASGILMAQDLTQDSINLSLEDAWQMALMHSKELKIKHLDTKVGDENILDAKRERLPEINLGGSYGELANVPVYVDGVLNDAQYIHLEDHTTYEASVEAYFNVYSGHRSKLHIQQEKIKAELLQHLENETESQIRFKVATQYLNLQRYLKFKNLIKQNIYQNKKRLDQIQQLYDNGVVLKSDLLRAQLRLSQQKTRLTIMNNNIVLATQALNIFMGNKDEQALKPTDSISIENSQVQKAYAAYVVQATSSSPMEKIVQSQVDLSKLKTKAVKANKLPKIGLFGAYTYSYPQIKLYPYETAPYLLGEIGIKVSYNLSSLLKNKHKEIAAKIEYKRQKIAKSDAEDKLRKGVKTAYSRYQEDLKKIEVSKKNIRQAKENYRIIDKTYFNQLALLTDLLDADTELLQAKLELVNNQIAARLHYDQLLKITGEI